MTNTICGVEFTREAFRLEHQAGPQAEELDAYHRWLDGDPLLPVRWRDWQAWLDRVQTMSKEAEIVRVILLDHPLTEYQQWRMWGAPWHHLAGEKILFMPFREALRLSIPIGNWWVFDREQVADIDGTMIIGPEVDAYLIGREVAIRHAVQTITA
jgi:hypothetical protein